MREGRRGKAPQIPLGTPRSDKTTPEFRLGVKRLLGLLMSSVLGRLYRSPHLADDIIGHEPLGLRIFRL
jgi:hypothetical protein